MKILQLCFRVPFPPHDGGAIAMYSITKGLKEAGHEVTVLAFNTPKHFQKEDVLKGLAVLKTVFVDTSVSPVKAFLNLFRQTPYNIERFISGDFEKALTDLLQKEQYDIVHFEGMYVSYYAELVRRHSGSPLVLRTHNLEYLIWERLALHEKNPFKKWYLKNLSEKLKKFETERFDKFDLIASISEVDANIMKALNVKTPIWIIPPGTDLQTISSDTKPKPQTMFILSALEWMPNREGLHWFLEHVWKKLHHRLPELELHIAGKNTPQYILDLQLPHVFVHGYVQDATSFMQQYDLMLVPLLSGSGVRIKIIEGMACGKCILSTSVGAEGIDYTKGKNILIGDTPEEWIDTIADYFNNFERYKEIGFNARNLIVNDYDNRKVTERLVKAYKSILN